MAELHNSPGYAVGWGALALINAGLAQSKGRGGGNWFLISLLLGPIATFLIVVLKPVLPGDKPRKEFDLNEFRKQ